MHLSLPMEIGSSALQHKVLLKTTVPTGYKAKMYPS